MPLNKDKILSISEVAKMFGLRNLKTKKLSTHTLRFWETKFKQLKPIILSGGKRYYSFQNIMVIKMIFFLLKDQGLTINGAIKVMNSNPKKLDATKSTSIRSNYYKKNIKLKSLEILKRIKKING
jgi:DNA-binding transcriptional MerR regulator